jgi:SAM-dependent methyltransferase
VGDRERWNRRYRETGHASFSVHPLAERAIECGVPAGAVADLACGASGSALWLAAAGRRVLAVDIAEAGLALLDEQARRRGVRALTGIVQADLTAWRAPGPVFALVLCTGYWDPAVFAAAASAVAPGGLLAWEAFTLDAAPRIPPSGACATASQPRCCRPGSPYSGSATGRASAVSCWRGTSLHNDAATSSRPRAANRRRGRT